MKINADFNLRVVVRPEDYQWVPSPQLGVERMMLDRIGEEVARATSLVRYEPNSSFPTHLHRGGEEIFVLEGTFADEHGQYSAGTYLRNPIGTSHAPKIGPQGATIFVKLRQFDIDDTRPICVQTREGEWYPGLVPGLEVMPLHNFGGENIALVKWAPDTLFSSHTHFGGEEIFVLRGTFHDEHGVYPKGTWIRSPHKSEHHPFTKNDGALIFVKTGHLPTQN